MTPSDSRRTGLVKVDASAALAPKTQHRDVRQLLDGFLRQTSPETQKVYRSAMLFFAMYLEQEEDWDLPARHEAEHDDGTARISMVTMRLFRGDSVDAHAVVARYRDWMQHTRKLAPNTINQRLAAIRSLSNFATVMGMCSWNLKVKGLRAENVRDARGPELPQMQKLLADAEEAGVETHALIRLAFECGFRSVELRELRWPEHFSEAKRQLLIRGKGQTGLRPVTVPEAAWTALVKWVTVRGNEAGFVFFKKGDVNSQLTKQAMHQRVMSFGKKYGVKLWPHALRHSAITAVLDITNGDVRATQKFSRHKRIDTVIKYDDQRRDVGGELAAKLSEAVKK